MTFEVTLFMKYFREMGIRSSRFFVCLFTTICYVSVVFMIVYWLYKFEIEDRDVGVVDYESLQTAPIELPLLSMCIQNPFIEKKLQDIDPSINSSSYLKYLKGELYDTKYEQIDYENVTIDMDKYTIRPMIKTFNDSEYKMIPGFKAKLHVTFNGIYGILSEQNFVKCFAVQLNKKDYVIRKMMKETIFLFAFYPLLSELSVPKGGPYPRVYYNIHYPEQFLLDANLFRRFIELKKPGVYSMQINSIEILKRRNKRSRTCVPDWKTYDSLILKKTH